MTEEIPEDVKRFIFDFIDSVELLDVLLLMSSDRSKLWNAGSMSRELRTNANSVETRFSTLKKIGLISADPSSPNDFHYHPATSELDAVVRRLSELNGIRRHQILRLIFSPLKRARLIADGFRVSTKKPEGGDEHG